MHKARWRILAGIILKLGVYGLIRFDFVILSAGTKYLSPIILVLGLIGSIGASINCVRQYDIKKLLAYSSISHTPGILDLGGLLEPGSRQRRLVE